MPASHTSVPSGYYPYYYSLPRLHCRFSVVGGRAVLARHLRMPACSLRAEVFGRALFNPGRARWLLHRGSGGGVACSPLSAPTPKAGRPTGVRLPRRPQLFGGCRRFELSIAPLRELSPESSDEPRSGHLRASRRGVSAEGDIRRRFVFRGCATRHA